MHPWNAAGDVLFAHEDYEEARQAYSLASFAENKAEYLYNMALSYYVLSKKIKQNRESYLIETINILETVKNLDSNRLKYAYLLSLAYFDLGKPEKAKSELINSYKDEQDDIAFYLLGEDLYHYIEELKNVEVNNDQAFYLLIGDPVLYDIYNLLKEVPLGKQRYLYFKGKYQKSTQKELIASHLNYLYSNIFEKDKYGFSNLTESEKEEALIVLFLRGDNNETISLIKKASTGKGLNENLFPPYTRALLLSYRNRVSISSKKEESTLVNIEINKAISLDKAYHLLKDVSLKLDSKLLKQLRELLSFLTFSKSKNAILINRLLNKDSIVGEDISLLKGAIYNERIAAIKKALRTIKVFHSDDYYAASSDLFVKLNVNEDEYALIMKDE